MKKVLFIICIMELVLLVVLGIKLFKLNEEKERISTFNMANEALVASLSRKNYVFNARIENLKDIGDENIYLEVTLKGTNENEKKFRKEFSCNLAEDGTEYWWGDKQIKINELKKGQLVQVEATGGPLTIIENGKEKEYEDPIGEGVTYINVTKITILDDK